MHASFCVFIYLLVLYTGYTYRVYRGGSCLCNLPEVTLRRRVQSRSATCKYSGSRDIWLVFFLPTIYILHTHTAKYATSLAPTFLPLWILAHVTQNQIICTLHANLKCTLSSINCHRILVLYPSHCARKI